MTQPGGRRAAATLEFRNVTKRYDGAAGRRGAGEPRPGAVNDLSFSVPAGAICVLVGPSGCGKTTSLKMVNRLIEPSSGQILLDGRNVLDEDPIALRRRIGYVIQQVGLLPHLTIADNVVTVPRLLGWNRQRQRQRSDELLALVGLTEQRATKVSKLSGGQRRRLDVAIGLAGDPELLFLDEPTTGFDPEARRAFWGLITALRDQGTTILLTTHYLDEAEQLADRVAVISSGRLVEVAPPADLGGRGQLEATVVWTDADGRHEVVTAAPTRTVAELADRFGTGEVPGLQVLRPTLEDVYLSLIGA